MEGCAGPVNKGIFVPAKQYTGQHNTNNNNIDNISSINNLILNKI